MEKKITARFTICDLVSFPVNIGCLFFLNLAELKNWRSWSWQDITPAKGMYNWYLGSDLLLLLDFQVCVRSSEKHLSIKPAVNLGVVRPTRYPGHVRSMAVSDCSKRGNMKAGQESFTSSTWVRKSWATEHETTMETSSHSRSKLKINPTANLFTEMSYFACWSSRPAVVRIFRILSQLLPMDQQQVLPPLLPLGCQEKTIFHPPGCLDPVNLGFCGLISCNWAQGLCWSPRTSIWIAPWTHCTIGRGLVGWNGLVHQKKIRDTSEQSERLHCIIYASCIILHFIPFTSSKSQWISVFLMRRTSTSRCSQKAFHPYPFCLLSASCLRGCKDTTTERGWVLEASSLHLSKHQLETWRSHGASPWIFLDQTYRSNLRKERGFNSKPC